MELCGQRDHEAARTSGGAGLKKADKGRGSLSSLVALLSLNNHLSAASGMQAADASVAGKSSHNVEPRNERCGSETAAPPWRRLWTSAVAAGLAEVLTMPLDFAKVRLMLQNISASEPSGVHYKGMTDCIARTVRAEGPATLFKGTGPALARQCGYTGLSFLLYEPILNGIATPGREVGYGKRLLAGGTAGGMGISVLNPMEVIKTQLQASGPANTSAADIFKRVLRTDGVLGFWAGIGPNIARTFLVCAAELGTYDEFKTQLLSRNLLADGPVAHLCASCTAAFASAGTATPVDVVKTRLMNQAGVQADNACSQQYRGVIDAFVSITTKEGPGALYKGFVPVFARKTLWCTSFFMTYEALKAP